MSVIPIDKIKTHYHQEYHSFITNVYYRLNNSYEYLIMEEIGFVNKIEKNIVKVITNHLQLQIKTITDVNSEREYLIIYNNKFITEEEIAKEINLCFLQIKYNQKFNKITHSQILGTLLNNDIDINSFGEIFQDTTENWYIWTTFDNIDCLKQNIPIIGKAKVDFIQQTEQINVNQEMQNIIIFSKSLRLDSIVKNIIHKNRKIAQSKIKNDEVRVEYQIINNYNLKIKENIVLSITKYGKYYIRAITPTKNGYRINIDKKI